MQWVVCVQQGTNEISASINVQQMSPSDISETADVTELHLRDSRFYRATSQRQHMSPSDISDSRR